jgi:hypothetical protein
MTRELTFTFDELSLIPDLWLHATGSACIEFESIDDWRITNIQLNQGLQRDNKPLAWLLPEDSKRDRVVFDLIASALRDFKAEDIEAEIADALLAERDDYPRPRAVVMDLTR